MDNEERTKLGWQINDDISNKPYKRKISLRTRQQSRQAKTDDLILEESPFKEQTKVTPTFKFQTQQKLFQRNQLVQEGQSGQEDDLRGTYIHYGNRQKHKNNQSNDQVINYDDEQGLIEGKTFIEELQKQGEYVDQFYLREDDMDKEVTHYGRHCGKTEDFMLNVGRDQLLNMTEDELLNMTEESDFLKITKTLHQRVGLANKTEKKMYDYENVPQRLRRQLEIKYYPEETMLIGESKYDKYTDYKQENLGQQYSKQDTQQQSIVEKVELNDDDENFEFGQKLGINFKTGGKEQEVSIIERIISEDQAVQHKCSDLVHDECQQDNRKKLSMTKGNLTVRQNEADPIKQDGENSKNMQQSCNQQQSSSSLVKIMISSSQNQPSSPSMTQQVINNQVDHNKLAQLPQELQSLLKNQPNKILEAQQDQEYEQLGISDKGDKKYEFIKILEDEEEMFIKENEEISSKLQEKLKQIHSMMSDQQKDLDAQAKYETRNKQQQQQIQQQVNQVSFQHQPQAIHLQHSINTSQSLPAIIPLTDDQYLHQDQNLQFPQSNIMIVMTSDEEECQKVELTLKKDDLSNICQFIPQSDVAIVMTNNSEDIVERIQKEIRMIQNNRQQQHNQSIEREQQFLSGKQNEEFAHENRPAQHNYSIKVDELRNMQQSKQSEYIINIPSSFGILQNIWLGGSLQNNSEQPNLTQDNNDLRLSTPNQAHLLRTTQLLSQNEIPSLLESSLGNQVQIIDQVKLQRQIQENPLSRKIHDDLRYLEPLNDQDIQSAIHIDPDLQLLEEEPFTGTITQAMIQDIITDVSPLRQVNPIDQTQEEREKMQEIRPRVTFNDQKTQYFIWSSSKQVIPDFGPQVMSSPNRIASNKSIIDSLNLISSPNIPQLSSLSQSSIPGSSQPSIPSNQLIIGSNKMIGQQADMALPSPIKQSITQNHNNNHEQTIFQSFDEGSISTTQYFDCNLLLNNSLSFSSNMVNRSLLQGNRGNVSIESGSIANVSIQQNNVGKNQEKQDYNTILQDLGEQEEQLNIHTKINKANNIDQSCNGHSKIDTDRKQKPSQQALENSFLNTSRSSPEKHRYHPQSSERLSLRELQALQSNRCQKMQLISQMSCIFIQLIKQHKSYYLQFLSQIQEQLFIYKQSFQHLKEEFLQLLNVKLAGVKEQLREEEGKKLREELELQYANRLEERLREELAAMEEDFLEREDNWRQDMMLRLQQQYANRQRQVKRDGYQGGEQQQYPQEEQDYEYEQQQYQNTQNNNRYSSTILPTQISLFRTTNSNISPTAIPHPRPQPFLQHQHHLQSILNQLQNQNQSLCQQLMLQQEHTQLMNEEQEKIRKKLRKMNDLEDELEEVKRENIHVKKLLFEVEEEKESIKELLQNELQRITADRHHQIKELQEQLRHKYEQQLLTMQQQFKSTILELTNNPSMQQSQQQVSQYRGQLERVQNQLQGSVQQAQQSKQTITQLTASNQQLKQQIVSLQQTILHIQSQLQNKTLKLHTQSLSSQKNIQSLEQKIEQLSKKNLQLISQLQQAIMQNAKTKEDVNRLKKEVEMGSREVARLRESQIQLYQQITELKKQGNSKDMEINRLEKKVQQVNRETVIGSNRESVINASSKISQLNTNRFRPNKEIVRNITSQNNINTNNNTSSILSSNLAGQPSLIHDPYTQHRHITRQLPILSNKPSLNEHCYTASNNAAVNKILENIRLKKSTVSIGNGQNNSIRQDISYNEPDHNSSYIRQLNQQGARPIVNNKLQSIQSYQFNPSLYQSSLKNIKGPITSFPSKIPAQEQFKVSHIVESNNTNQELYHQFSSNDPNNRSNISNLSQVSQHQAYPSRQITAMISPKSPSSSSVLSKKVSSSQKDKKMSIISLKLQKLRSDIREEIKEISHIK